jgi:DNA-binding CsgD family transcriptional regulator
VARRLRAGLGDGAGIGVAVASVALALALSVVPALEPWRERAGWVLGWGLAVCLASALVAAWSWPPGLPPQPRPEPAPRPAAHPAAPVGPVGPAPGGAAPYPDGLTGREVEVLRLLARGRTNKEIAAALVVSVPTAERHVANIYAKIGARGRADATAYALRHGLVD